MRAETTSCVGRADGAAAAVTGPAAGRAPASAACCSGVGAVTAAILIWSQHFSDTLLRREAPAGRAGLGIRLGLHTVGAGLVVAGVLAASVPLVIVGASVVAAAILAHAVVLFLQLRRALPSRFGPLVRYYVAAAVVLAMPISPRHSTSMPGSAAASISCR